MVRIITLFGLTLALSLAGCVSSKDNKLAMQARTPSELYPMKTERRPEQVLLAVHGDGLSPAQVEAVSGLAAKWRDGGGETIQISGPHGAVDSYAVYKTMQAVRDRLTALGVPDASISQRSYDAGADAKAPLMVEFTRYEAVLPACGKSWENLTSTENNAVQSNFGCAVSANMAAQIANPGDIAAPRASDPTDAGRRVTVMEAYRKGQMTSAVADDKANGAVSKALGQ
jgi:pilus assembly protein CpaD